MHAITLHALAVGPFLFHTFSFIVVFFHIAHCCIEFVPKCCIVIVYPLQVLCPYFLALHQFLVHLGGNCLHCRVVSLRVVSISANIAQSIDRIFDIQSSSGATVLAKPLTILDGPRLRILPYSRMSSSIARLHWFSLVGNQCTPTVGHGPAVTRSKSCLMAFEMSLNHFYPLIDVFTRYHYSVWQYCLG